MGRENLREWLKQLSVPVYLLIILFGISAWIEMEGLWTELPLLVNELPKYWNLPSYVTLMANVGNVGLLTYAAYHRLTHGEPKEALVLYITIGLGALCCLIMTFVWRETKIIGGEPHSLAFLSLMACLSLVDCTSSVVYLTYVGQFKPHYMSAYYVGEGISGVLPSLIGLIQDTGDDPVCRNQTIYWKNETNGMNYTDTELVAYYDPPKFSVEVYFFILFGMMCISGIAFALLHNLPICQKEKIPKKDAVKNNQLGNFETDHPAEDGQKPTFEQSEASKIYLHVEDNKDNPMMSNRNFYLLLVLCFLTNAWIFGIIPSTMSYTCLPYGNMVYNLSLRLSYLALPLVSFFSLFVTSTSLGVMTGLLLFANGIISFHLYLAAMSPSPPLQYETSGRYIVITTTVLYMALLWYVRCIIASTAQTSGHKYALMWVGVMTQLGNLTGSVLSFSLVTVVGVFEDIAKCDMPYVKMG